MTKTALKYGLILGSCLSAFFLIMHFFNLSQNYNLRMLNGVIHLSVIYLAIKAGLSEKIISGDNYVSAVFLGMFSSFVGVALFAFFQMVFLKLNPDFMTQIQESISIGEYLNPFTASLIILVEGVAVSLIGSYIIARILFRNVDEPAV